MKKVFLALFCVCVALALTAQEVITRESADSKLLKSYERALQSARAGESADALKVLQAALRESPHFVDALLLRGQIYYDQKQYAQAEADLTQALQLAPNYDPKAWYPMAMSQLRQEKFAMAAQSFEQFLSFPTRNEQLRQRAVRNAANARFAAEAINHPVPFVPRPLSDSINTDAPESLPSLTADGSMLVFTRIVDRQEDFYASTRLADQTWSQARPLEGVNTPWNEGAQCIAADGRALVFNVCNTPEGFGSCDIYLSRKSGDRWSRPENLGASVNSKWMERQPALSADGSVLYFSSDRPGGYGGRDIWRSRRNTEGVWSTPENLGAEINTDGHEDCPFLHADGRTLYFMSDGHPGMGGFDLFLSRLSPTGKFEKPQNLGYPINTPANEGALIVSLDGKTAYFTTDAVNKQKSVYINTDIYAFEMPEHLRPVPATYVRAVVRDAQSKKWLRAKASLYLLPENTLLQREETDQEGAFLFCIPAGVNYALHVESEGYLFHSEHFQPEYGADVSAPFLLDILLSPVLPAQNQPSVPVALRNVFFTSGSAALLPESQAELERLKEFLNAHPQVHIEVRGHTDNVGSDADNLKLSGLRAKAVCDYLSDQGISAERLAFKGFGETQPIASNDTPEGRRQNRRTEFVVIPR